MKSTSHQLLILLLLAGIISCSTPSSVEVFNEFRLDILDSIQVDYQGIASAVDFQDGKGILYDTQKSTIVLFDSTGTILYQESYPSEGPGSFSWVGGIRFHPSGKIILTTLIGEIVRLDEQLRIEQKFAMPFPPELRDMQGNARTFDFYEDNLLIFYPGRDGQSPYKRDYWKENKLIEQLNLSTGKIKPIISLAADSKHQSDAYFERPFPKVAIHQNLLYLHLDTESIIAVYDLSKDGAYIESLDFAPSKYVQYEGQQKQVGYVSGNFMSRSNSFNLFAMEDALVIHYCEGIHKDDFINAGLNEKKNWYKIPDLEGRFLKVYQPSIGWSNEILVPPVINQIMNIEHINKPFYAIRNDEYIGEEQDFITLYKLQLSPIKPLK
jgi:hypothetical protein